MSKPLTIHYVWFDEMHRDALEEQPTDTWRSVYAKDEADARFAELEAELERERMRLAACGVVAMANTPESAARARDMHPDYRSASCDDVARAVDAEMAMRAERDAARSTRSTRRL